MEASEKPPRRRRRIIRRALLGLLATIVLAAGVLVWLVRSEPAHWQEHQAYLDSTSPQEIEQTAQSVEQRVLAFAKMLTGPQTAEAGTIADVETQVSGEASDTNETKQPVVRKVLLKPHELNAWIAERFEDWMSYRDYDMPEQIQDPMIAVNRDDLKLSFAYRTGRFEQVFTAGFLVTFREDGKAILNLRDVAAGRLSIPADGIGDYLRDHAPDKGQANKVAGWLDKMHRIEFKPSMKLGEHKVHVLRYDVLEHGVELTVRVEQR